MKKKKFLWAGIGLIIGLVVGFVGSFVALSGIEEAGSEFEDNDNDDNYELNGEELYGGDEGIA